LLENNKSLGRVDDFSPTYTFLLMKKVLFYLGILLCILGFFPLLQYALDYNSISDYGKGYVWGKVVILSIGVGTIFISRRL